MTTIGFIGLGHMGTPMAKNLLHAGYQVKVFDITSEAMKPLVSEGALVEKSVLDVVEDSDVVITMLQTGEQVSEVCLNENGIFAHLNQNALYIDSSSIAIGATQHLHKRAKEKGLAMVDAPVSGGVKGAENASLTIMVGGEPAHFEKAKTILQHLGKLIIHAGPPGSGQAAKICNNMILGISMIAVSEAFILAERLGLAPKKLFEIVSHASGQCWSLTNYCPMPGILDGVPSNSNYEPGFSANMMLKDLHLSQDAAKLTHTNTTLGATATEVYKKFSQSQHGNMDFSGIITMIRED